MKQKDNTPEEIKQALEYLIHTANKHKAVIVGYLYSNDEEFPWIVRTANIKGDTFDAVINRIHKLAQLKFAQGKNVLHQVKEEN